MNPTSFSELNLLAPLQLAIEESGYTTPTPIQAEAIPHLLAGRDLMGCAQTGTGKTAAFALPLLHHMASTQRAATPKAPRVLVLSPTRELAAQIGESFATYGRHLKFRQTVVFGGVGQVPQVRAMNRGVHVLVATPGRLLDLMNQGHIKLDRLEYFVLDEADRMLDMGFLPDLRRIIACLPAKRQSLFFSATLPPHAAELAETLLTDPVRVAISPQSATVELIEQRVMFVERHDKEALLHRVLDAPHVARALVFTRTKHGADRVAQRLNRGGIQADAIHGNKSQTARTRVLDGFRNGRLAVLVATDVAARGIDVDGITHVINYDMPHEAESYVHRIGRTGRAGAAGIALSFCDSTERDSLRAIEKLTRTSIDVDAEHPFHSTAVAAPARTGGPKRPGGQRRSGSGRPGGQRRTGGPGHTGGPNSGPPRNRRRRTRRQGVVANRSEG
ncbi:MAG: DEAD/DEAH box helicase [Planctomycetaceae bacterium]